MGVERQYERALRSHPRQGRRIDRFPRPHPFDLSSGRAPPGPRRGPHARLAACSARPRNCSIAPWNAAAINPAKGAGRRGDRRHGPPRRRPAGGRLGAAIRPQPVRRRRLRPAGGPVGRPGSSPVRPRGRRWPCRPARSSKCSRPSPCWNRGRSIRNSRSSAKAICTTPADALRALCSPRHRARRRDAGRRPGAELQRLFLPFRRSMGPGPLVDWAGGSGSAGRRASICPAKRPASCPATTIRRLEGHAWRTADTQVMAIGQGSLTATPLQVLRMMAAVATGKLFTPHVADRGQRPGQGTAPGDAAADRRPAARHAGGHSRGACARGRRSEGHGLRHGHSRVDRGGRQDGHGRAGAGRGDMPGSPAMSPPTGRNWPLWSFWNMPATPPPPPARWSSGW